MTYYDYANANANMTWIKEGMPTIQRILAKRDFPGPKSYRPEGYRAGSSGF